MKQNYSFRIVFAAACLGMLMFGIVIIILGSILPSLIDKFHLDEVGAGVLTSLLPLGILVGSLLFGPLVDRYSYKYLLVVSSIVIVAGIEGIATTENILILQGSILIIGIGGGAINGGTNALVADISSNNASKRGSNLSFLGVFFGVGALGMPLLLGFLSEYFDYFEIIAASGLVLLLPAVLFTVIRYPQAKQGHGVPLKESLRLAKDPSLILLGMILFFQSGIEGIISNWSTLFLVTESGFIHDHALFALSVFVISLTITRLVLTFVLNRARSYKVLIISVIIAFGGIVSLMVSFPKHELVGLALLGAGLAAGFPLVLSYVGSLYSNMSGTAFSLVLVIGLAGNILLNLVMGLTSNSLGISVYPSLLIICAICMAIVLYLTLKRISKHTYI
jgi:fucose permease